MQTPHPLAGSGLIAIGEMLHSSIQAPGERMRRLFEAGEAAWSQPGEDLDYLRNLVAEQAAQGADYIDVNLDALGGDVAALMRRYVGLVAEAGAGVPASVDSSNPLVLQAGLEEWFRLGCPAAPLVNSIPFNEMERYAPLMQLRAKHPFRAILLLVGPAGPLASAGEMLETARAMVRRAREAGFANDDLLVDCVTLGIASDGCMGPDGEIKSSHTRESFHAMRAIRSDAELAGVHAVLGVSNWVYGARKRRIGHLRAFIAVAQRFGLDAAIVDVGKRFGIEPAPPELVQFVEMFVSLDGGEDSMMRYSGAMADARRQEWL